ncbi:MAG TPA: HEAT repeat domain-containing protein [Methylomirabilota bacterium]|nr:HEAT repeat domain-containing protein [Methylomirabilota bacterium]
MMRILLLLAAATLSLGAASPLPQPIAPWKIEVVAEAPAVRHPSVVACAPDGRVFVSEDPMDISLPNANAAEGRILCIHPDGRINVFADKLFAVFGLQYLEGKLYVLHNPHFSVFDDDASVGRNRRELIQQTLPDPSALNWNDHIPANFKLGMDGYFYVAAGDKGLHGAVGTDGRRADLFTGGVFRIKPDGSGLEVFSHGVRNILDVALNSGDEIFSYDNTDEHEWMGRVTHMVEAGFYGYPHDFIPQRPYTLWMLADLGPGAACGAFAYNEDALPANYHGNIFLSDFGKRQVMRLALERSGSTYKMVSREDLFPNPPGDFRPVGITLGPDGKSIYICDWQHRDEKAKVTVGRLLKLTWTGEDQSKPKPGWHAAVASGQPRNVPAEQFIDALSHPSHDVRLTAQRALEKIPTARESITSLAGNPEAPAHARIHAIWALANSGSVSAAAREAKNSNPRVQQQAIRALALSGGTNAASLLTPLLGSTNFTTRFAAATALGRLGDPRAVEPLLGQIGKGDLFANYAVFTALNRIGTNTPSAWRQIVSALHSSDPAVREGVSFAIRDTYDVQLARELSHFLSATNHTVAGRLLAARALASTLHQPAPWSGEWWGYHPALQPPPKRETRWAGTETILQALIEGSRSKENEIRAICIQAIAAARDERAVAALRSAFESEQSAESRALILRALAAASDASAGQWALAELSTPSSQPMAFAAIAAAEIIKTEELKSALLRYAQERATNTSLRAAAISTLGSLKHAPAAPLAKELVRSHEPELRRRALIAHAALSGETSIPELESALISADTDTSLEAVRALGRLKSPRAIPGLMQAYGVEALRSEAFRGLASSPDKRALGIYLRELTSINPAQRDMAHLAVRNLAPQVRAEIEQQAPSLPKSALTELRQIYAGDPVAEKGPIFAATIEQPKADDYLAAALSGKGDPAKGEKLFIDANGLNCIGCHRVGGAGSTIGPDLSNAGQQFDAKALAESIIHPSKAVREGYQQIVLELGDEEEMSGLIKSETAKELTLVDGSGRSHTIPREKVRVRRNSELSLMPEGLHAGLTTEQFADLISYLATLRAR